MTGLREVPAPRQGSGPVVCCGGHRERCLFGNGTHSWATWYENAKLQRTSDTYRCNLCGGICTGEEDEDSLTEQDMIRIRAERASADNPMMNGAAGNG